jgi:hypothetical protein
MMPVPAAPLPIETFAPPAPASTWRVSFDSLQARSDSEKKTQRKAHEALAAIAEDGMMSSFPDPREPEKHARRP